jgi:hypothetical protein
MLHGREPVGDDDRRATVEERVEGALHHRLAGEVERARRLVEDEDRRIREEGARERDELPLARREPAAARVDIGVVPLRELLDEAVRADAMTSSRVASGRPIEILSATVPLKRKLSWVTMTTARRRSALEISRTSVPSILTDPSVTS